jgi:hypothetical protein
VLRSCVCQWFTRRSHTAETSAHNAAQHSRSNLFSYSPQCQWCNQGHLCLRDCSLYLWHHGTITTHSGQQHATSIIHTSNAVSSCQWCNQGHLCLRDCSLYLWHHGTITTHSGQQHATSIIHTSNAVSSCQWCNQGHLCLRDCSLYLWHHWTCNTAPPRMIIPIKSRW